jgi:predicted outer membrane protein
MGGQAIRPARTLRVVWRGIWRGCLSLLAAAILAGQGVAGAQPEPAAPMTTDERIVIRQHRFNEMMMAAGRLAYTKGTMAAVRDYGAALVRDYQAADIALLTYAGQLKIDMNISPFQSAADVDIDRAERDLMETLRRASAGEFDYRFAKAMQQLHLRAITSVADARVKVREQNLNKLLDDSLGILRNHEQFATNLINETQPVFRHL